MLQPLRILCLAIVLPLGNTAFAQRVTVKSGDEFKIKSDGRAEIFGNDKDNYAALVFDGAGVKLCGFNRGLSVAYSNEVDFKAKSLFDRHLDVYNLGSKYYWLHSTYDKAKNESYLFADEINIKEGKVNLSETPLLVNEPVAGTSASMYKFFFRTNDAYTVAGTPDHQYLGMGYIIKPDRDGGDFDHVDIKAHVFEDGFKQTWEKKVRVNTTSNAVLIEDAVVTKAGELYLLLSHKSRNKTESLELLYFKSGAAGPVSIKPDFNSVASLLGFRLAAYGSQVAIGGFYQQEEKSNRPDGFYLYTVADNKGQLQLFPVEETLFNAGKGGAGAKLAANLKFLAMAEMIAMEDGGLYLTSEIRSHSNSSSSATGNSSTTFRYGNIYSARFDENSKLLWTEKIPKLQMTNQVPDAIGIKTLQGKNAVVTIMNDNVDNDGLEDGDKVKAASLGSGGVNMANVLIDKKGKKTRTVQDFGKMLILPSSFEQIATGSYIGLAHTRGRSFMPVRVDIK